MKIRLQLLLSIAVFWATTHVVLAQERESLNVRYMLTYDQQTDRFTAWVVPNYNTPNENNPEAEEKGATAQVTLRVPKGYVVENIQNLKGAWDKNPMRFGSEAGFLKAGANAAFEYYVIGKAPVETNYGNFRQYEPVALFSFSGKGAAPQEINILNRKDPFIDIANNVYALNVGNSFYSRSGQSRSVNATPVEQFSARTGISEVLSEIAEKNQTEIQLPDQEFDPAMQLIAYPNPVVNQLNINYFAVTSVETVKVELIADNGEIRNTTQFKVVQGVNTLTLPVSTMNPGVYIVRMKVDQTIISKKILKIE